jgi:hypothetical protein
VTLAESGWEFVAKHEALQDRMEKMKFASGAESPKLGCMRMMGTFVGAATAPAPEPEEAATPPALEGREAATAPAPARKGLILQTASLLFEQRRSARAVFLIGSDNKAMPMDRVPYRFYTYLFVASVVKELLRQLKEEARKNPLEERALVSNRVVIRFTFVPEDILFAQFFFDDLYLFIAATYSWEAVKGVPEAYAALALDNNLHGYDRTAQRLTEIFDARYRLEAEALGEEVWTLRQSEGGSYVALVSTPFWQRGKSILQPYDFTYRGTVQNIELGENSLEEFRKHLLRMWGQEGSRP